MDYTEVKNLFHRIGQLRDSSLKVSHVAGPLAGQIAFLGGYAVIEAQMAFKGIQLLQRIYEQHELDKHQKLEMEQLQDNQENDLSDLSKRQEAARQELKQNQQAEQEAMEVKHNVPNQALDVIGATPEQRQALATQQRAESLELQSRYQTKSEILAVAQSQEIQSMRGEQIHKTKDLEERQKHQQEESQSRSRQSLEHGH
jgi:hypothetical protein